MSDSGQTQLHRRAMAQFERLVDLDAATRLAELDALARDDAALHALVRRMLDADRAAEAGDFLGGGAEAQLRGLGEFAGPASSRLQPGSAFGAYRLERPLGSGGMGEVWLATRADGLYEGQVAIKTLHAHLAQPGMRERFAREGRILGRLQHPNIARLLDAGTADDGRLYLVLEYVAGEHLTAWCDARQLGIRERLQLFLQICAAVSQAHAQLVVHRDLKPSNILVTESGEPKLLDFGIAKLLEGDAGGDTAPGEQTALTRLGGRALTPEYAAPEQLLGQPVSTATDVYALGVLLYQLLCGLRPHAGDTAPQLELAVLQNEPRPLAQAATHRDNGDRSDPAARAAQRGLTPQSLRKALHGDLDNILRKALRRLPEQRYASVSALADDLRRHLAHEPVGARADSLAYRAGKFMRRYRSGLAAAAVVTLALLVGLGVALWQAGLAREQARRAELQKSFLLSLFQEQDPLSRARAQARTPAELIAEGVRSAKAASANDPLLSAELLDSLGEVQLSVDRPQVALATLEDALALQRASLDRDDLALANTLDHVAAAHIVAGRLLDARAPLDEALAIFRARLGAGHIRTAQSENRLARLLLSTQPDEAVALMQSVYARYRAHHGPDHADTLARLQDLGVVYAQADRIDEAERTFREVIERQQQRLGPDHLVLAYPLASLADLLRIRRRYADAAPDYERAIRIAESQLGTTHPLVAKIRMRRGDLLRRMDRFDEATAEFDKALAGLTERDGAHLAQLHQLQGHVYRDQGRYADAEARYRQSFERFGEVLGDGDVTTWEAALTVGDAQTARGDLKQAEATLRDAMQRLEKLSPADGYDIAQSAGMLARVRRMQGAYDEALALDRRSLAAFRKIYGEADDSTLEIQNALAADLIALGDAAAVAEARTLLDDALAQSQAAQNPVLQGSLLLTSAATARRQSESPRAEREHNRALTLLGAAGAKGERVLVELKPLLASH